MTQQEIKILNEKIKKGLTLSFQRLVEKTKKEDGELVISRNGKVIRIKARDLQ
jgi:hypothetical protein